jgi:putative Holliday junction resolvase
MDGTDTALTDTVKHFAAQLQQRFHRPVALVDERLSSHAAEDELRTARSQGQLRRRVVRSDVDRIAAKILVEQWLRTHAGLPVKPQSPDPQP